MIRLAGNAAGPPSRMLDMVRNTPFKILLAKPGLDGHDVGAKIVVRALIDAGFDVIYTGLKKTPEEIVQLVTEKTPDILGLSILSGSHVSLCQHVADLLHAHAVENLIWIVGGNIPEEDHDALKQIGVEGVFAIGSSIDAIVGFINHHIARKSPTQHNETVS